MGNYRNVGRGGGREIKSGHAGTVGIIGLGCIAVLINLVLYLASLAFIAYAVLTILWYFDVRIDQFAPFWE